MSINSEEEINDVLEEIYEWLDQIPFSRPRKNLVRDFSNGVFMAELLKQYYPKLVDLHNYSSSNSLTKKIETWSMLNKRVLSKIGIKLNKEVINQIASGQTRIIETILMKLRSKILKDCNDERRSMLCTASDSEMSKNEVDSVLNIDEVQNKRIPRSVYLKLRQELQEKNDVIAMLNDRIYHLESLIKLKDQRIADLSTQVIRLDKS